MRRRGQLCTLAVLATMLGTSLLFCANAQAKTPQTITFTSRLPSPPVAGEHFELSASTSSGEPVYLGLEGACSFRKPAPDVEESLETEPPPPVLHQMSPQTVYFVESRFCSINASVESDSEHEETRLTEAFTVGRDPFEQIMFTSLEPSNAVVGGSYKPVVKSSAGLEVGFSSGTPNVCAIANRSVEFRSPGTCMIGVNQFRNNQLKYQVPELEGPEVQQSFTVVKALPETITIITPPPTQALAGERYDVLATSSSGKPVAMTASGVCSLEPPPAHELWNLSEMNRLTVTGIAALLSPATVYLGQAGLCEIFASRQEEEAYEAASATQRFIVARNPEKRIRFLSSPQSDLTVEGNYVPVVESSARLGIYFTSATPAVCVLALGEDSSSLSFLSAGTCTIQARQDGVSETEPPEAQQSFNVSRRSSAPNRPGEAQQTPTKVKKSETRKGTRAAETRIPAKVRASLLKGAAECARAGEHGAISEIRAVRTTLGKAGHASDERNLSPETPVYVVAMRTGSHPCPQKKGETCAPEKDVLELEYLASTLERLRQEPRVDYPDLTKLGVPVLLAAVVPAQ